MGNRGKCRVGICCSYWWITSPSINLLPACDLDRETWAMKSIMAQVLCFAPQQESKCLYWSANPSLALIVFYNVLIVHGSLVLLFFFSGWHHWAAERRCPTIPGCWVDPMVQPRSKLGLSELVRHWVGFGQPLPSGTASAMPSNRIGGLRFHDPLDLGPPHPRARHRCTQSPWFFRDCFTLMFFLDVLRDLVPATYRPTREKNTADHSMTSSHCIHAWQTSSCKNTLSSLTIVMTDRCHRIVAVVGLSRSWTHWINFVWLAWYLLTMSILCFITLELWYLRGIWCTKKCRC